MRTQIGQRTQCFEACQFRNRTAHANAKKMHLLKFGKSLPPCAANSETNNFQTAPAIRYLLKLFQIVIRFTAAQMAMCAHYPNFLVASAPK